jgi:hypothetical protein
MTESAQNVQVAAGAFAGFAPAGTVKPTLPASGPIVADPIAPWKDLGYVTEDGITNTRSRSTENFGAWQSPSPIAVLVTEITDVLGFSIREWNQNAFAFTYGIPATPAAKLWEPSKLTIASVAMVLQWDWLSYASQLYIPRGTIQGDTETVLARTAPADLAVEFISTPSGTEAIWTFETLHPAFASIPTGLEAFATEDGGTEIRAGKSKEAA